MNNDEISISSSSINISNDFINYSPFTNPFWSTIHSMETTRPQVITKSNVEEVLTKIEREIIIKKANSSSLNDVISQCQLDLLQKVREEINKIS